MLLLLNVYKVFVVNTEPRLHFGAQCNVSVGSSGGGLESLGLYLDAKGCDLCGLVVVITW